MAMLLATVDELAAVDSVTSARARAGVSDIAWNAVQEHEWEQSLPCEVAILPAHQIKTAAEAASKIVQAMIPADPDAVPPIPGQPERREALTSAEQVQVGLLYRLARQKYGQADEDPFGNPATAMVSLGPLPMGGGGAAMLAPPPPKDTRKLEMNQILDQTDESEISPLSTVDHRQFWTLLRQRKSGEIRADTEPSDDQIAALKVRVLDLGLSPYADFAL